MLLPALLFPSRFDPLTCSFYCTIMETWHQLEPMKGQRRCHSVSGSLLCRTTAPFRTGFAHFLYETPDFSRSVQDLLISCTKCLIFPIPYRKVLFLSGKICLLKVCGFRAGLAPQTVRIMWVTIISDRLYILAMHRRCILLGFRKCRAQPFPICLPG